MLKPIRAGRGIDDLNRYVERKSLTTALGCSHSRPNPIINLEFLELIFWGESLR